MYFIYILVVYVYCPPINNIDIFNVNVRGTLRQSRSGVCPKVFHFASLALVLQVAINTCTRTHTRTHTLHTHTVAGEGSGGVVVSLAEGCSCWRKAKQQSTPRNTSNCCSFHLSLFFSVSFSLFNLMENILWFESCLWHCLLLLHASARLHMIHTRE